MVRSLAHGAAFVALFVAMIPFALAQENAVQKAPELQSRLNELEKNQDEIFKQLAQTSGSVGTFLNDQLSIGGYLDTGLTGIWGNGTNSQFSITPTNFAINLAAGLNESLRINSQVLFNVSYPLDSPNNNSNAPSVGFPATRQFDPLTTTISLPQAYLEYGSAPELSVQVGRGYVPFGIAFQLRDLALFRRRGGPQMISANQSGNIVIASGTWSGLHLGGTLPFAERRWGYDVYSLTPATNPGTVGGGARAWVEIFSKFTLGFSSQVAKRHGPTFEAVGVDLSIKSERLGLESEYAVNYTGAGVGVGRSFYVEPFYIFYGGKLLFYGAADYLANPTGTLMGSANNLPDPFEKWEFGGGLNWLPYSFTRFRLGLLYNDYTGSTPSFTGVNRNYTSLDLSAGVEF